MKDKIISTLLLIVTAIFLVLVVMLILDSGKIKTEKIVIGPHNPTDWCSGKTLTATDEILIKSSQQFTVSDEEGIFVISSTPGELALGEKSPDFLASLEAKEGDSYRISLCTEVYAEKDTSITLSHYNGADNFFKGLLLFVLWALICVIILSAA